jgi:hypothetical protein
MKRLTQILLFSFVVLMFGCKSAPKKTDNPQIELQKDKYEKIEKIIPADVIERLRMSNGKISQQEEFYVIGENWNELLGKLKLDSSTSVKNHSYKIDNNGIEARIELYYQKAQIVRVEKRIYNETEELSFSMFDFYENECLCNTIWNKQDKMSYSYSMLLGALAKYDVNYNPIEMSDLEKRQVIESTKVSLDSIMHHFPEFKYSFNWK